MALVLHVLHERMSKIGLEVALWAVEDAPEVDGLLVHVEGAARLREPRAPVVLGIVLEHARTPGTLEMRLPGRAVRKVIFNLAQGEHPLTSWAGRLLTLIVTLPLHVLNEIYGEIGLELTVGAFEVSPEVLPLLVSLKSSRAHGEPLRAPGALFLRGHSSPPALTLFHLTQDAGFKVGF